jgi:hypothetical protein
MARSDFARFIKLFVADLESAFCLRRKVFFQNYNRKRNPWSLGKELANDLHLAVTISFSQVCTLEAEIIVTTFGGTPVSAVR